MRSHTNCSNSWRKESNTNNNDKQDEHTHTLTRTHKERDFALPLVIFRTASEKDEGDRSDKVLQGIQFRLTLFIYRLSILLVVPVSNTQNSFNIDYLTI